MRGSHEGRAGAAVGWCKGWPWEVGAAPIQHEPLWGADERWLRVEIRRVSPKERF